jgi:hypothetical protein
MTRSKGQFRHGIEDGDDRPLELLREDVFERMAARLGRRKARIKTTTKKTPRAKPSKGALRE